MKIVPAILPKDFAELEEKIELIHGAVNAVQVDISDGKFVSSSTWPYKKHDENFESILREERGMPAWEDIDYEFDLMISNPSEDDARTWISAGAARVILHIESSSDLTPVLKILHGLVEIGIALNIDTPVSDLLKYKEYIQVVQCMGIRRIGYQGEAFDERVLSKIREVKEVLPDVPVSVDGGVSLDTITLLKEAGVDTVIVGSTIFSSDDIIHTIAELKRS